MAKSNKPTVEEKKKARSDYEKLMGKVMDLKEMTDTAAWRSFYDQIQQDLAEHGRRVLDVEKTRDIIQHQEGVKILKHMIDSVKQPVTNMKRYVREMPLFAQDFKTFAEWNEALGKVELTEAD